MIERLLTLLGIRRDDRNADASRRSGTQNPAQPKAEAEPRPPQSASKPPTNEHAPLIRNRYVREDTGTHETLTILDDSMIDSGEETGFDPYNTGDFDRSKNWERRFRS